jgi:DNA transposition AAA+ family ATPase
MKKVMAITKNVRKFRAAVEELWEQPPGVERLGVLYAGNGEGKTTAIDHVMDKTNGVGLRAKRLWTPTEMLRELSTELKVAHSPRRAPMQNGIIEKLIDEPRPVFVDEIDHLFAPGHQREGMDILEIFRDIYDCVMEAEIGVPFVFIGEEQTAINIQKTGRFARRVTSWVEFSGIDLADARAVAEARCEVGVEDDLLQHVFKAAAANVGRIIVGLTSIERFGLSSGLKAVNLEQWGDRPLFFDQPVFGKKKAAGR